MDHSFNPIFAQRYGMVAAVLIHDFAYWTAKNRANGKHMHDGLCWTYNSAKAFQEQYPYMSKGQIYAALKKMLDDGLIVKGDFNADRWVHTPWYAITEKGYSVILECSIKSEEHRNDRDSENQTVESSEFEQSSFENHDDDVAKSERGRSENATTYTYIPNTILGTPDTDNHLSNTDRELNKAEAAEAGACAGEVNPYGGDRIGDDGDSLRPAATSLGEGGLGSGGRETVERYAANSLLALSATAMEEIAGYVDGLSEAVVRHAIDIALDNGVRKWAYVRAILMDYTSAGVKSVAEAKAYDERKRRKNRSGGNKDGPYAGLDRSRNRVPEKYGGGEVL